MRKRKMKGINEDTIIRTMPNLLQRIEEEYEKRKKEASIKQEVQKASLAAAIEEEKRLIRKIGLAKEIAEGLEDEFQEIEATVEKKKMKEATKGVLREDDVRSGKTSLKQFILEGKRDSEISDEVLKKSAAELEQGLIAIRKQNREILEVEERLGECRNRVRGLVIQPGVFMLEILKGLKEFTEQETGLFQEEMEGYRSDWNLTKHKLQCCEGRSLGRGFTWERILVQQAKRIVFDPILPVELVPDLKAKLAPYEDDVIVMISCYYKDRTVEVRPCVIESYSVEE